MKDTRQAVKMPPGVKVVVNEIRKELGFKTESQVVAYLCAMYKDQKGKRITLADHQKYVQESDEIQNQGTL